MLTDPIRSPSPLATLHPFQAEAIAALHSSRIHLALTAPTGAGKGVILEHLARDPKERILLLTPLIALGRQQAERFERSGIAVHSTIGIAKTKFRTERQPSARVWISSPEAALSARNARRILEWKPTLIAVDEAHCIQEWGEDFRPAYRQLVDFVAQSEVKRSLWMSATFPRTAVETLRTKIPGRWKTQGRFRLPRNLTILEQRTRSTDRIEILHAAVRKKTEAGILFAGTRKNVERFHRLFQSGALPFLPYHAGMSDEERRGVEARLSRTQGSSFSVIATNAFGMGMDYRHLRWVMLAQAPFSLLGLMQAIGRVARGTESGEAEIYWAEEDFRMAGYWIGSDFATAKAAKDLAMLRRYFEASADEKKSILAETFL